MGRLGAHVSASGGVHHVFQRGVEVGCDAIQIFTRNQRQWNPLPLDPQVIRKFFDERAASPIRYIASHASYLINLASPEPEQWEKSKYALFDEMNRAQLLRLNSVVVHPGSHKGKGVSFGISRIADAVNWLFERMPEVNCSLLLENTAGQGDQLGSTFQELSEIINRIHLNQNVGVCIDTAHAFEAGYDLASASGYRQTMDTLLSSIDINRIQLFHLNDSKTGLGSRKDRHENIGMGDLGLRAFEWLLQDSRFEESPMILETPGGDEWFETNLKLLRSMETRPSNHSISVPESFPETNRRKYVD